MNQQNIEMLTHFSLFSGIGANDLAAEWAGFKTVGQCEWADFPTKILGKHWPDVPRWRDIHDLTGESIRQRGINDITVLSGGFPCQPHSVAGKREASADGRDLWPEFKRVICEANPKWVVGENVSGLLSSENGRFFGGILRDLAQMGFVTGWCSISANWVGAPHRRERVFIVAHSKRYKQRWEEPRDGKVGRMGGIIEPVAWDRDWESALCEFRRMDDGLSYGVERLDTLRNAIIPHQVYPIYQAIADIERSVNVRRERQ